MEKKEAAPAHPLGVCEKLYNAFANRPSLIHLRRPRLTSGANSHVAEGHHSPSDSISSSPPAAAKDNQQKTAAAAALTLPKEVPPPQKEKLATKPPETQSPQIPKDQQRNTNLPPSVTKLPTRQATIPEKQNVAQSGPPTAPEKTGRPPTSVLRLGTEKAKIAAPAVSPPPPPAAAVQGKAAPPPAAPPTAPAVQAKLPAPAAPPTGPSLQTKAPLPVAPPTVPQVQRKAPPPVAPPTTAAPAALPTVAAEEKGKPGVAEKPAPVSEKGKAAAPMRTITNINEKSENFIRRARNSWRSSSAVGGTRKES
ncbi:lysine-rich arabinogalactan protein 19-like [Nymphaea colorata]|uniref:lysine-rich arabinogalactan protein 19-like n=1 Tax=Nymphaea colorata TaxID=210225 RepID=UPI00129E1464|nr:lysine-rich arabinogalactan protein 19-like [Nymphaea colorata]